MKKRIITAILVLFQLPAYAGDAIEDGRFWFAYNLDYKINDSWKATIQLQPRWRNEGDNFDQMIYKPAIYYKLSPHASVGGGYEYLLTHPAGRANTHEQRLWEDFIYRFDLPSDVKLTARTRLDQRRLEGKSDTAHRIREMLKLSVPVSAIEGLSLVFSDEYFLNVNNTDWGVVRGFDQNRIFAGVGYKFSEHTNVEFGYLNQYVNKRPIDLENHVLSFTLNNQF